MAFTRKTEVRHISAVELIKIAQMLAQPSTNPAWKKLMLKVPHELTHHENLNESKAKYNFDHIKSIEHYGMKQNKLAAQIFLEEWTTSGKIRPTLSHLLQLLVNSELFRAADYVAINLLSEAPPQRPIRGPAARVDIALPQEVGVDDELLNGNYPNSSAIMNLKNGQGCSKNIPSKQIFDRMSTPNGPAESQASDSNNSQRGIMNHIGTNSTALQSKNNETRPSAPERTSPITGSSLHQYVSVHQLQTPQSDWSSSCSSGFTPDFGAINTPSNNSNDFNRRDHSERSISENIPHLSVINVAGPRNSTAQCDEIPNLSIFNAADTQTSTSQRMDDYIPNLSGLNVADSQISTGHRMDDYIPNLSGLNVVDNQSSTGYRIDEYIPILSALNVATTQNSILHRIDDNIPNLSGLNVVDTQNSIGQDVDDNIPNLSGLNVADTQHSAEHPNLSVFNLNDDTGNSTEQTDYSGNIPQFSSLLSQSSSIIG